MQPTTSFDWGRVVAPARWVAKVVSAVIIAFGGFMLTWYIGSQNTALTSLPQQVVLNAALGVLLAAGLLLAVLWQGMGEVIGGLLVIGVDVGFLVGPPLYGELPPLVAIIPSAIVSLVFVACGWYTLAHRHPSAAHTTA